MKAERLMPTDVAPEGYKAVDNVEMYIRSCGLEMSLIELVKYRASQINGCAFCLDLHSKRARRSGETEQRVYLLSAWEESTLYTPRERAALAWTEAVTNISTTHASDSAYEALREHYSDKEIVDLTILVGLINLWNRLAISMRYHFEADPVEGVIAG